MYQSFFFLFNFKSIACLELLLISSMLARCSCLHCAFCFLFLEVKKNGTDNEKRKETWRIAQFAGTAVVIAVIVPLSIHIQRRRIARRRTLAASQRSSIAPVAPYNHRSSAISNQTSRRSEASSASAPPINDPPKYDELPPDYNVAIQLEFDQPVGAVNTGEVLNQPSVPSAP